MQRCHKAHSLLGGAHSVRMQPIALCLSLQWKVIRQMLFEEQANWSRLKPTSDTEISQFGFTVPLFVLVQLLRVTVD